MLKVDEFEKALVGSCYDLAVGEFRLVYNLEKCVDILVDRDGCSRSDAKDYIHYNTTGSFIASDQPLFVEPMAMKEIVNEHR